MLNALWGMDTGIFLWATAIGFLAGDEKEMGALSNNLTKLGLLIMSALIYWSLVSK